GENVILSDISKKTISTKGVDQMLTAIIIVGIVMTVPITAIVTDHQRRLAKIKADMMKDEIELEKIRQKNFIIETEKMKIELDKMRLDFSSENHDLVKVKGIQ
ncbi:MAG: hypothetical protein RR588_17120, partial [Solibacillus sp.]